MANGALESFVKSAGTELEDIRINVISPVIVKETIELYGMESDVRLSAPDTAKACVATVIKDFKGEILDTRDY